MERRITRQHLAAANLIHGLGTAFAAAYLLYVFPAPVEDRGLLTPTTGVAAAVVAMAFASAYSMTMSKRDLRDVWARLEDLGPDECRAIIRYPLLAARRSATVWGIAALAFGLIGVAEAGPTYGLEVATTVALAGVVCTTAHALVLERVMRPLTALALGRPPAPEAGALGLGPRLLLVWALCSGAPIIGIALIPVGRGGESELTLPIVFVCAVTLVAGLFVTKLAVQQVSRPVRELRRAVDAVGGGDLGVRVAVDDASEIGRLQAGFNAMVSGLRERERLADLYGRQVGDAVMREALARGPALGGELREITALFIDIIGSTALAHRERPEQVVKTLNGFFAIVVESVERHGGLVNKFEGDAALCLFGAPADHPDHAARALRCAVDIRHRLHVLGGLQAATGVASGTAVVGYVGAESRFEYTAIGDCVNEAARLTELAKHRPERLLASAAAVRLARGEAGEWVEVGKEVLRGRAAPTTILVPAARVRVAPAPA